ncbi:SusD/RagB family nutrient-binding outer membrane lipoprotein [Desertivirga xinjiangensis]|uniref:SusD/RagB family nutrient-binding outer membrane lipoprotein n=1 Tax=Desertivirga xinjiangensis TaxID=539206 RepID=UPI002109D3D4|nr:SusD/RagB family nutrient-binding outer membrane lipoprotein [Pedobacter xinjiangensis]
MKKNLRSSIIYYPVYCLLAITLLACNKQLDINDNPARLTREQVSLAGLLAATIEYTDSTFFNVGQYGNYYPQYFAGSANQEANIDSYNPYGFDNIWRSAYLNAMPNLKELTERSEAQGAPQYAGIGKLLMALNLMQATDIWGDLPYSEAFQGAANLSPRYDPQEQIYMVHLKGLLDGAIADLQKPLPESTTLRVGTSDHIYKGNIANWLKAAYATRARYYLHLTEKDAANYQNAANDAALAFDDKTGSLDLQLRYTTDRPSPWFTHLGNTVQASKHARPSTYFINLLNGTFYPGLLDPRISKFVDNAGAATYVGRPVGSLGNENGANLANTDITANTYYGARTAIVPIITYSETQFIRAEALLNTNRAEAYTAYRNGIEGSLLKLGITNPSVYLDDPRIAVGAASLTLSNIMLQKYIALFMQMETWTDLRRHEYSTSIYPGFAPPLRNFLGSSFVQRAKYADNEPGRNANVPRIPDQAQKIWLFTN